MSNTNLQSLIMSKFEEAYNTRNADIIVPFLPDDFRYGADVAGGRDIISNKSQYENWLRSNLLNIVSAGTVRMKTKVIPNRDGTPSNVLLIVESVTPFIESEYSFLIITFRDSKPIRAYLSGAHNIQISPYYLSMGRLLAPKVVNSPDFAKEPVSKQQGLNLKYQLFDSKAQEYVKKNSIDAEENSYSATKLLPHRLQNALNIKDLTQLLPYIDDNIIFNDYVYDSIAGYNQFLALLQMLIRDDIRARQSDSRYVLVKNKTDYFVFSDFEYDYETGKLIEVTFYPEMRAIEEAPPAVSLTINLIKEYIELAM
ncbi:MAG: hypothetical protein IJT12_03030 [Paludibacteraceae bacterium]|nr:hypothetical protein [Paludibacteraceae bacterium]